MFNGSHNFAITGGTFNSAGGDVNIFFPEKERGLTTLYHHTSTSASFDAGARYPPPLCHPGTRQVILQDLKDWGSKAVGTNNPPIRWLYGPAGAGKSAIAQTFAQTCAENGSLLGSFFFWHSDPSRNDPQRLFTTLALQMAIAVPQLRAAVNAAVTNDPFVPTSSIEKQWDMLVVQPWLKAQLHQQLIHNGTPFPATSSNNEPITSGNGHHTVQVLDHAELSGTGTRIWIIDGLDECSDSHNQQYILSLLAQIVQKFRLPIQILVCSRPEPRIKECFAGLEYRNICQWMALNDTYQASKDIRLFLVDGFKKILVHHSHSMAHVPRPWPTSEQIEYLVEKSSGQFIYASTVLKYINGDGDVPADCLNVILGLQVVAHRGADSPYAELDALYLQILSTVRPRKQELLLQVLAAQLVYSGLPHLFIHFLGIPVGTLCATFSSVHALFQDPSPVASGFQFTHASFADFLLDQNRSLQFHIDKSLGHDLLAQGCLELYNDLQGFRNTYACEKWAYHYIHASGSDELMAKLDSFPVYAAITTAVRYNDREWKSNLAESLHMILQIGYKSQAST
ncbi:hypothetical protein GYMLUDRAFT_251057 [Collybiopsis luxurians FD-317 M1]|uniref:Nephrocystin 3-like N-terminal domain-containing protein n=1 Tax=Collybiopsis luxurians FD-317 M1 TaxID=944289 RepID=A0A0D0CCP3_9AGAR|nr:hypothetical protein GYMLUDRAFT_251057 [Collybiopsis luxurians FD-317 M1]